MTEGVFNPQSGEYYLTNESNINSISPSGEYKDEIITENETRTFVVFDYLYHPGLASFRFSTFFNMCRLNNISYDIAEKMGTIFILMDSMAAGCLGIISSNKSLSESMKIIGMTFQFLTKQIGGVSTDKTDFQLEDSNIELIYSTIKTMYKEIEKGSRGNPWVICVQ